MVVWHSEFGKTDSEIAALAGCSEWTIREILRLHREYGVVQNPHVQPRGHRHSLATADLNYLSSILNVNPCLYLDELQSWLATDRDIDVSISTIFCAV
jgi:transposase